MVEKSKRKSSALIIGVILLGCLLVLFFGMRIFRDFKKFGGPPKPPPFAEELETDVDLIEDWMTIPFISHTYGLPPDVLFDTLKISPKETHKKSLKEINEEYFPEQDGYVLETVKATVLALLPPLPPEAPTEPGAPPTATLQAVPTP